MAEEKKYLSNTDMNIIELHSEKAKLLEKEEELSMLKLQLIESQKMLINYKILEDRKRLSSIREESKESLKAISKTYEIPEEVKWSYNPSDGEIIINDG